MAEQKHKPDAGALVKVLSKAASNAKGWTSTAAGVALIALGVFMAWKLGQQEAGTSAILLGIGFVFTRDPAPAEPKVEKVNGGQGA